MRCGIAVPAGTPRSRTCDGGEVERVEHQLDPVPDQQRVDLVGVALQRHQRGLGHRAVGFPEERLGQRGRGGQRERAAGVPARERRVPGLGVDAAVVDGLDPGGEQPVQLVQIGDLVPALGRRRRRWWARR